MLAVAVAETLLIMEAHQLTQLQAVLVVVETALLQGQSLLQVMVRLQLVQVAVVVVQQTLCLACLMVAMVVQV
jgi:hypothetical protein